MSVCEEKQRKRADWVWKETTLSPNTLIIYGWNIFTALLCFAVFLTTQAPCFFKPNKVYDLYISRFHRTNSPFSYFKSIRNSTGPDMHYQIQFLIFFTSLHFIHPLRYSNHNALASSGCKNVLISFDSCPCHPTPSGFLPRFCVSVNLASLEAHTKASRGVRVPRHTQNATHRLSVRLKHTDKRMAVNRVYRWFASVELDALRRTVAPINSLKRHY